MIVLWGVPTGNDFSWDLTYKFTTEDHTSSAGYQVTYQSYSLPIRELSMTYGGSGDDSYAQFLNLLCAGATFAVAPVWMFRTSLAAGVSIGASEVKVTSLVDVAVGDYIMLFKHSEPSTCEVKQISSIAGTTLYLDTAVTNEYVPFTAPTSSLIYDTRSAFVLPCLRGLISYENIEFLDGPPCWSFKIKLDGGVWSNASLPTSIPTYSTRPMSATYISPKIERIVSGIENGVLQLRSFGTTSKAMFECTWHFLNEEWKSFRELFLATKGKAENFHLPTGMHEVRVTRGSDYGSTTIYLEEGYRYFIDRYPMIRVYSRSTNASHLVLLTDHISYDEFTCSPLTQETNEGDRACVAPLLRFANDELTFTFKDVRACEVKAQFLEVVTEQPPLGYVEYNPCSQISELLEE